MALTVGTGRAPEGESAFSYDASAHIRYLEDSPRRVRVVVAGETVAQSSRAWRGLAVRDLALARVRALTRRAHLGPEARVRSNHDRTTSSTSSATSRSVTR
jgi:hypothetical protein